MIVECSECGSELERSNKSKNYFCNSTCKGEWQRKRKFLDGFTKEWLEDQYLIQKKSGDQIAREIGKDPKTVWNWLIGMSIKTRPRGTDYGQNFKTGNESKFKGKKHTQENKDKQRERRLIDGHVPYKKDGIHWLKHEGVKPASWRGGITPDRQAFYSTEEWSDAVKEIWKRDNAKCRRCGKSHNETGNRGTFHIHHIKSFMVKELRADVNNLILVCNVCHRWIHGKENTQKLFIEESF